MGSGTFAKCGAGLGGYLQSPFFGNVPTLGLTLHLSQPASSFVQNFTLLQKFGFLFLQIQ